MSSPRAQPPPPGRIDTLSAGIGPPLALTRERPLTCPAAEQGHPSGVADIKSEWPTSPRN